ncbi:MAG: exodeoxyribonuclease III [Steroidobacteraceae bacterium]|jgi:exodeoxyribonuclease-3|nr:exodeoxyribonuclease III [Steroidobacteraceae bacterium]
MRIASWNVNSLRVRLPQLAEWTAAGPADVIGLQELKLPDEEFPREAVAELGFQAAWAGQKTYNGVALLSRAPLEDVVAGIPGYDDPQRRVIAATVAGVRVIDVYVPNGQAVGSEKFAYKLDWMGRLRDYVAAELARHPRLALVGDFNVAPEDRDVHDPKAWEGSVHVSPEERAALGRLLEAGLVDTFRLFEQPPASFSWWDYRMGAFRRNHGLRIDLVLASKALAERCTGCSVDRGPRAWERPSDHAPVVASFDVG